jgi:hypothetical protein
MYMNPQYNDAEPKTFLGAPSLNKYTFRVSMKLPFIQFPIGDGTTSEDNAFLSGLLDTGGCCNMGNLSYHKEIATRFPALVSEIIDLDEQKYEKITIGGIQGGVSLTHMIRYYIPYTENGKCCVLTLGLTDDLPIDTLLGIGFQMDAKISIDTAGLKAHLALFQDTYQIQMKEPRKTDPTAIAAEEHQRPMILATQPN